MPSLLFKTITQLQTLIDEYFTQLEGEYHEIEKPGKEGKTPSVTIEKICDRKTQPPTYTGLIFSLGFNSRQQFDSCCSDGDFADILSRARLQIEACYEKKLHSQSSAGAIFALKSMGWNEKPETPTKDAEGLNILKIQVTDNVPGLAANEKEVAL